MLSHTVVINRRVHLYFENGMKITNEGDISVIGMDENTVLLTLNGTSQTFSAVEKTPTGRVSSVALHTSINGVCKYIEFNSTNITCQLDGVFAFLKIGDEVSIERCMTAPLLSSYFPLVVRVTFAEEE